MSTGRSDVSRTVLRSPRTPVHPDQAKHHEEVEDQLRESHRLFKAVSDGANDAIISADEGGKITYVNPAGERMFGYGPDELLGSQITRLMPERFRDQHRTAFDRHLATGERRFIGREYEVEGRRKDGTEFPVEVSLSTPYQGERPVYTAVLRDLTDRKAAEEAERLRVTARERTRLLDQMVETLDTERMSLAAALHDAPIQRLAEAAIRLRTISLAVGTDAEGARAQLAELEDLITGEIETLRHIMTSLRPPSLDYGVGPALADLGEEFAQRSSVDFHVRTTEALRLAMAPETALFRIAQEAMSNVLRHSEATNCWVSLREEGEDVVLVVKDDGRGFDAAGALGKRGGLHFGLVVMQERAEMVGGTCTIGSRPGRGTEVLVRVPRQLGESRSSEVPRANPQP